jgi:intron-binding protein aquarius
LGLYVLGRREVFESSLELRDAFEVLFERPNKLALVAGEMFPAERRVEDAVEGVEMESVEHLGNYVFEMTKAKVEALKEGGGNLPPLMGMKMDEESEDGEGLAANGDGEGDDDEDVQAVN